MRTTLKLLKLFPLNRLKSSVCLVTLPKKSIRLRSFHVKEMIHIKYAVECNYIINRKEVFLKNSLKIEYRERDRDRVYLQNVRDDTKKS